MAPQGVQELKGQTSKPYQPEFFEHQPQPESAVNSKLLATVPKKLEVIDTDSLKQTKANVAMVRELENKIEEFIKSPQLKELNGV